MKASTKTSSSSKGESHRIYWQQWPSSAAAKKSKPTVSSRRDLITSSAAIRISPVGARAQDVTHLLCETLNLKSLPKNNNNDDNSPVASSTRQESWDRVQDAWEQDSLVLVGTLYSLPLNHLRFEHERLDLVSSNEEASSSSKPVMARNDPPFHVIKTLKGTDNPIQVRNAMIEHLETILSESSAAAASSTNGSRRTTSISPKLQWYFVPGVNHPSSPIPSYIDLDGYATSMEEDDHDDEEEDVGSHHQEEDFSENDMEAEDILMNLSSSLEKKNDMDCMEDQTDTKPSSTKSMGRSEKERIFKKERQLYFELSLCQSSLQQDCVSGYLLKQSMTDPHVWKRVHCVLTDEHLWYISRIHTRSDQEDPASSSSNKQDSPTSDTTPPKQQPKEFYSFAKHRRIGLTRALLLQPSADKPTNPLLRTPFAFEVIGANGSAHRFRASNPENYKRWVTALQARIVQAYENSLLEHAELIVRDETEARNKRFTSISVEPIWDMQQQHRPAVAAISQDPKRHDPLDDPTLQILRFGIEVTQYREHCRHIEAILPAKYPVLAMTDSTPELRLNGNQNGQSDSGSVRSNANSGAFRLDTKMQALIKSAWDEAVRLGGRATKLAVALQAASGNASAKMPRSLETICQHLEYVITGNLRGSNGKNSKPANMRPDNTRQYPPPVDLFDQLLLELQSGASVVSAKARRDATHTASSVRSFQGTAPRKIIQQGENK